MKRRTKPRSRTILVPVEDETMASEVGVNYPLVKPHRIYQVALRCGLRTLRANPERLVREALDVPASNAETPAGGAR